MRDILFRCLDSNPAKRFPNAQALRIELAKLPVNAAALSAAPQEASRITVDEDAERTTATST